VYQPMQHEAGRAMVGSTIGAARNCRIGQRPQFQVSACVVCRTDYQTCTPTPGIIVSTPPSSTLAPHIVLAELGDKCETYVIPVCCDRGSDIVSKHANRNLMN